MGAILPEAYARWRGTRLGEVTEQIEQNLVLGLTGQLAGRRVLDMGCGDGAYAISAAGRGALVTAVDPSGEMLDAARHRASEAGVDVSFDRADASQLPFDDGSFDVVLAVTVLCFVEDAPLAVNEMARVLAPGGKLILADLSRWSTWAAWRRLRGYLGSRTWRWARFRSARELSRLTTRAGLDVQQAVGAVYYPPFGLLAQHLAPLDRSLGAVTTLGAAFVAVAANTPPRLHKPRPSLGGMQ